ncbi:MAG TPA: glucuronate isomerase [Planctomycetota bacterium]
MIGQKVRKAVERVQVTDIHTHLYDPAMGELLAWGVDELLTYHYLIAEFFRGSPMSYADFRALPLKSRADAIWKTLFVDRSPVSEACRGVLTALDLLGLPVKKRDLGLIRKWYAKRDRKKHIDEVFKLAGMTDCVMTNDPFDDQESPYWVKGYRADERFKPALRIDPVLLGWEHSWKRLAEWDFEVSRELTPKTIDELKRFLVEWVERTKGLYVGVSLPPTFNAPEESDTGVILEKALLPVCEELNLPLALMIGVKRRVNPELTMAGDAVGTARIEPVEYLCAKFPKNKFMLTMLARENQHAACVAARKFRNLHLFGCWWFVNNPSIIREMTEQRVELLGLSFTPQHSDARVLDQVLYKWTHSRKVIGDVLAQKYEDLAATGWTPTDQEIQRDVEGLFGGNFRAFLKRAL